MMSGIRRRFMRSAATEGAGCCLDGLATSAPAFTAAAAAAAAALTAAAPGSSPRVTATAQSPTADDLEGDTGPPSPGSVGSVEAEAPPPSPLPMTCSSVARISGTRAWSWTWQTKATAA